MLQEPLTPREFQVLDLLALGLGDRQIARQLGISSRTVEHMNLQCYRKLDVRNRTEAMVFYVSARKFIRIRNRNYKSQRE